MYQLLYDYKNLLFWKWNVEPDEIGRIIEKQVYVYICFVATAYIYYKDYIVYRINVNFTFVTKITT